MMVVMLYSQGFKFEAGDKCVFFLAGIFSDSAYGTIKDVIEDKLGSYQYRINPVQYRGIRRAPFNHVFTRTLVVMDEDAFQAEGFKRGDELQIRRMKVEQEEVYSKKKKRKIQ